MFCEFAGLIREEEDLPVAFRHLAGVDQMLEKDLEALADAQDVELNASKHLVELDEKRFMLVSWMSFETL